MHLPVLSLPRALPSLPDRPPQSNIPPTREDRERLKLLADRYARTEQLVTPLSLEELRTHADELVRRVGLDEAFRDYAAILINSAAWRDQLATVPFERRLLLLPKCLRVEDRCPAPFDEFGLLCKQCGLCTIQDLQAEAERLGYAVLVAEGSALVMAIIQTGKIDAIVGVSCLSVLEKAFPYMEAAAIPGVAVPLLQDDCHDTALDIEWLWDVIHLTSDDRTHRLDLDALRREVETWFTLDELTRLMGPAASRSEQIARDWLAQAGKRWRPFLTVCAWKSLQDDPDTPLPDGLRKLAVAVECFHKASLIHDDIEDDDSERYGKAAVHTAHGVPVALNVGDLLLGEGYRLIAESDAEPRIRSAMLRVAAEGHRTLCLGQGEELCWAREPRPLSPVEVIEIFRQKTAPAFEVALRVGALYAGGGDEVQEVLSKYSAALGIAYQIRDDVDDMDGGDGGSDLLAMRPSLPLALAMERHRGDEHVWQRGPGAAEAARKLFDEHRVRERAQGLLNAYKEEAVRALADLENATLKGLLRRVISKIFTVEVQGWCSEFETRNAAGRPVSAAAAG